MLHPGRFRVIATATWKFPVYSQTFVYQELTQLLNKSFDLRFFYGQPDQRKHLPAQFDRLWGARRRHIFYHTLLRKNYEYFIQRMPQKVQQLVDMISLNSGMPVEDVRNHHHFAEGFTFARLVEAFRPDYLHSYFFYHGTFHTFMASYLLDIPRGVSCYADHMLKDYEFKMIPLHLNQCRILVATSNRIKQELLGLAPGCNSNQILVKPNAINAAEFRKTKRTIPRTNEPFRIVTVSRIEPKKGLIYLVEAIRILRDRNLNVEAHLIGGVDRFQLSKDYDRELKARIDELNISSSVHLEGFQTQDEIVKHFLKCSLFVAPFIETEYGDKDGIPTSLLEGMASGLPVVATNAGSILEVVEDGIEGIIVPQRNAESLAKAIEKLMNDSDVLASMGEKARQKIRERFDVMVCEQRLHERLTNVLQLEKKIKFQMKARLQTN